MLCNADQCKTSGLQAVELQVSLNLQLKLQLQYLDFTATSRLYSIREKSESGHASDAHASLHKTDHLTVSIAKAQI